MNIKGFFVAIYSFFSLIIGIIFMSLFKTKIHSFRRLWAHSMLKIIGVKLVHIGKLDTSADMIVLNHNSMLDIIVLEHLHPKDIAWVARSSLAQAPLFGYIFKLPNLILIDHKKRSSIKYLSQRAKEEHQNSRPIAIFPEGTRGKDNSIKKFQAGAKIVANNLELKVQPIVLTNTRDRLDTDNLRSSSGEVEIIYLDTIDTKDKEWYKKVEESINRTYNKYS